MRYAKFLVLVLLFSFASVCLALPKVLIVQVNVDPKSDPNTIPLADALAQALEEEGRSDPIVWSMTDPVFRDAALDGRVPNTDKPSPNDVQAAQKALGCDYVLLAQVRVQGSQLAGRVDLYKGTKQFWNDVNAVDTKSEVGMALENATRSLARTWAIRMSAGPLKSITAEPKPPTAPGPSRGQVPNPTVADPIRVVDSSQAIAEYQKLMDQKKVEEATNLLRQAVDQSPLDVALRIQLIKHLSQIGRTRQAAEEATRASLLLPDSSELREMAAKAYIDSGQSDQAEAQLNEQLARNPNDASTRGMLADIALNKLMAQAAMDHIDVALKYGPCKDLAYRRALCAALLGDDKSVRADIENASRLPNWNSSSEESYQFCLRIFLQGMDQSIGDLRSLNQRAAVKPNDPEVAKSLDTQFAILVARQSYIDLWIPPASHQKSQGVISLALKLLSQSLSELKAYLSDGSQDTLTDASIDLGESIKQLASARDDLTAEGSSARDGSTTVYLNH